MGGLPADTLGVTCPLLTALLFLTSPAWAAPIDDATAANGRGYYAAELRIQGRWRLKVRLGRSIFLGKATVADLIGVSRRTTPKRLSGTG